MYKIVGTTPHLATVHLTRLLHAQDGVQRIAQARMEKRHARELHVLLHALGGQRVAAEYRVDVNCARRESITSASIRVIVCAPSPSREKQNNYPIISERRPCPDYKTDMYIEQTPNPHYIIQLFYDPIVYNCSTILHYTTVQRPNTYHRL